MKKFLISLFLSYFLLINPAKADNQLSDRSYQLFIPNTTVEEVNEFLIQRSLDTRWQLVDESKHSLVFEKTNEIDNKAALVFYCLFISTDINMAKSRMRYTFLEQDGGVKVSCLGQLIQHPDRPNESTTAVRLSSKLGIVRLKEKFADRLPPGEQLTTDDISLLEAANKVLNDRSTKYD